jgi:hypothetical protein
MSDVLDRAEVGDRKVDYARGTVDTRVSRQWFRRPQDQRFLTLRELADHVTSRWSRCEEETLSLKQLRWEPNADDGAGLTVSYGGRLLMPTNWAFSQTCSALRLPYKDGTIGVPAQYLRALPAQLAAINLNVAGQLQRGEQGKLFMEHRVDGSELRALTSPTYGRIGDAAVVEQLLGIERQGWKVPGVLDWSRGSYDPNVPVSFDTTTLFASDRDVWVFLCDDTHPIEVGKLANGDPDLMFRGFIVSNSEVGSKTFLVSTMYLRAVCCNRCLWGVERQASIEIRHTSRAPERFQTEAMPALEDFTHGDPQRLVEGVRTAKEAKVATKEEEQIKFLTDLGFSTKASKVILTGERESIDGDPLTAWDMAQAITRYAQTKEHADERFEVEAVAGKVLDKAIN